MPSILFIAFTWSPLAHAAFFYVAEAYKTAFLLDPAGSEPVLTLADSFVKLLYIAWFPIVGLTGIGWLLAAIGILRQDKIPAHNWAVHAAYDVPCFSHSSSPCSRMPFPRR
ncbi:MAG: hypothetical protein LBU32_22330 [Clostridiales bacterium]|nr:hypothetical protein [Clostridiales bacterium]